MKKFAIVCLRIILIFSSLIGAGIVMLCASGWQYNFQQGNYPAIFKIWSFWMYLGAILIILSMLCCILAISSKYYIFNFPALLFSISGYLVCMGILSGFCEYADQNFSGIGDSMQSVSGLYQDRISFILVPVILIIAFSVGQFLKSKDYRIKKYQEKLSKENAEAQSILDD